MASRLVRLLLLSLTAQMVSRSLAADGVPAAAADGAGRLPSSGPEPRRRPTRLRWTTPLRLKRLPLQRIAEHVDLPDYGRFELASGITITFSSPNYPDDYPSGIWTSWLFSTADNADSLHLACPDFQLGAQDQLIVRRGERGPLTRFIRGSPPEMESPLPLLVQLRSRHSGRLRCSVRTAAPPGAGAAPTLALTPSAAQTEPTSSEGTVQSRPPSPGLGPVPTENRPLLPDPGPVSAVNRPLFPESRPVDSETKPLFPESRPVDSETRPLFPESRPVDSETRPLFPESRPVDSETRPLFPESRPVDSETRPLFPESGSVSTQNRPLLPELKPVLAQNRPLFLESSPVITETKPQPGPVLAQNESPLHQSQPFSTNVRPLLSEPKPILVQNKPLLSDVGPAWRRRNCGRVLQNTRIIGGQVAEEKAFPWLAAITSSIGSVPFCGASIINEFFVLTAAHCVRGRRENRISVMVKKYKSFRDPTEVRLKPKRIIIHPDYDKIYQYNDIALIELSESMSPLFETADGRVQPVCLPSAPCRADSSATCFTGRHGLVAGWGLTNAVTLSSSSILLRVKLPVLSNAECRADYAGVYNITDRMLCAGLETGGKDTCQGDSGGPLVVKGDDDLFTMVGIVSFGQGCGVAGSPGVYTRISEYLDWIAESAQP